MTGDPVEQEKRVRYTTLIANNVMLYNVQELTRVIKLLREQGYEVTDEKLRVLSPYMTDHIRRFGDFVLNLDMVVEPLQFNL